MKLAVYTLPDILPDEPSVLDGILDSGADYVHLRKPGSDPDSIRRILDGISHENIRRIVLHDFFFLAGEYPIRQLCLNSRNRAVPPGYNGNICRSCHSLEEVSEYKKDCLYVTLSPIFDSISKEGYRSSFTASLLGESSLIDSSVFALGGVDPSSLDLLYSLGFGGAAMLGYIWEDYMKLGEESVYSRVAAARKAADALMYNNQ